MLFWIFLGIAVWTCLGLIAFIWHLILSAGQPRTRSDKWFGQTFWRCIRLGLVALLIVLGDALDASSETDSL